MDRIRPGYHARPYFFLMMLLVRLINFLFFHFYHGFAWTYDVVAAAVSFGRWRGWGKCALPFLRAGRVIEIGFGPGHLQLEMGRKGASAFGLDESAQMVSQARARLKRAGMPVPLVQGNAQNLPFATASVENILSVFPSGYISNPPTLAEIKRVLVPGGRLVLLPAASMHPSALPEKLVVWLFHVTRQNAAAIQPVQDRFENLLHQAGFHTRAHAVAYQGSTVLIIEAEPFAAAD